MSACPEMTFDGLSPEQYEQLLSKAQAEGLNLTGESGSVTYQGIDVTWSYDGAAQQLTIHCTNKPFFVPCSMIEDKLRGLIG